MFLLVTSVSKVQKYSVPLGGQFTLLATCSSHRYQANQRSHYTLKVMVIALYTSISKNFFTVFKTVLRFSIEGFFSSRNCAKLRYLVLTFEKVKARDYRLIVAWLKWLEFPVNKDR